MPSEYFALKKKSNFSTDFTPELLSNVKLLGSPIVFTLWSDVVPEFRKLFKLPSTHCQAVFFNVCIKLIKSQRDKQRKEMKTNSKILALREKKANLRYKQITCMRFI